MDGKLLATVVNYFRRRVHDVVTVATSVLLTAQKIKIRREKKEESWNWEEGVKHEDGSLPLPRGCQTKTYHSRQW
jgi:hypothetical protein